LGRLGNVRVFESRVLFLTASGAGEEGTTTRVDTRAYLAHKQSIAGFTRYVKYLLDGTDIWR